MKTVAGVFKSIEEARRSASRLRHSGFSHGRVNLLFPGTSEESIHSVAGCESEHSGAAVGGVVGAGRVFAAGAAGAAFVTALDETPELPSGEVFFYEDALRHDRSLAIVIAGNDQEGERAQKLMSEDGGESLESARHSWWNELRDAEEEHYQAQGENFTTDQDAYRQGFEAALRRECRGKTIEEARDCLRVNFPDLWETKPFVAGYRRGIAHHERVQSSGWDEHPISRS